MGPATAAKIHKLAVMETTASASSPSPDWNALIVVLPCGGWRSNRISIWPELMLDWGNPFDITIAEPAFRLRREHVSFYFNIERTATKRSQTKCSPNWQRDQHADFAVFQERHDHALSASAFNDDQVGHGTEDREVSGERARHREREPRGFPAYFRDRLQNRLQKQDSRNVADEIRQSGRNEAQQFHRAAQKPPQGSIPGTCDDMNWAEGVYDNE